MAGLMPVIERHPALRYLAAKDAIMEKIILVALGVSPARNTMDFACYLAGLTHSKLVGSFAEIAPYADHPEQKVVFGMPYLEPIVAGNHPEVVAQQEAVHRAIQLFRDTCEDRGLPLAIRLQKAPDTDLLLQESRYADVLIVDAEASLTLEKGAAPSPFVKRLLAEAQCPVIIAPVVPQPVEEVVICYDGSRAAWFAMKQLAYLFPELSGARATVLEVIKQGEANLQEKKLITDWLCRHFAYANYEALQGDPQDQLTTYLLQKKNALAVMGAYGRSLLSRFFKQSHADGLIQTLACPVFITHY